MKISAELLTEAYETLSAIKAIESCMPDSEWVIRDTQHRQFLGPLEIDTNLRIETDLGQELYDCFCLILSESLVPAFKQSIRELINSKKSEIAAKGIELE